MMREIIVQSYALLLLLCYGNIIVRSTVYSLF